MPSEFTGVQFEDSTRAETSLNVVRNRLSSNLLPPLAALLKESPDPDGALALLERYSVSAPADVVAALSQHPTALTYIVAVFGYSPFLAETLLDEPALTVQFARDRNFSKLKTKDDLLQDFARFNTTNPDPWLSAQLARFKRRNFVRILLKDVLGLSTFGEVALELSALADVILREALSFCDSELAKRYGRPQYRDAEGRIAESRFAVVSLGELGGQELNYSSDLDLLFLYAEDGETSGGNEPQAVISNKEYFVHLALAVTRTLTQSTPQGDVYRVDLGLRPGGEQGDPAISLTSALAYYQRRAESRQLRMLIKARHSAGDPRLTHDFLHWVEPSIYRRSSGQEARGKPAPARSPVSKDAPAAREAGLDVKFAKGGIRDLEFLTQYLQRLHGQADAWVRSGGTLLGLGKLNDKGWLADEDYAGLTSAYTFLRKVEHRIQMEQGQETQRLRADRAALRRLGRRVGVERGSVPDEGEALLQQVTQTLRRVEETCHRLMLSERPPSVIAAFDLTAQSISSFDRGPSSFQALLSLLDFRAPELAMALRQVSLPERTRRNARRLFSAFLSTAERFHMARQNPELVRRALDVVASSDHLAENLVDHPEDIPALEGPGASAGAEAYAGAGITEPKLDMEIDSSAWPAPFAWVSEPGVSFDDRMSLLRHEFRWHFLALGAADVSGLDSIYACLARWSALAARAVSSAFAIAQGEAEPANPGNRQDLPVAVLALGRLGLNEFDLGSPVRLVFLAEAGTSPEEFAFANRLASRTLDVLASYTREGTVLAVDARRWPEGREGELVVWEDLLVDFLQNSAEVCEIMAFLKARPIAGHREWARRIAERIIQGCLGRFSAGSMPQDELFDTRRRPIEAGSANGSRSEVELAGYWSLDVAVSYLRLRHRVGLPPGTNTCRQIEALRSRGLVSGADAETLQQGAGFLRTVDHAVRLATGKPAEGLPQQSGHADSVEALVRRWGLVGANESLPSRLGETQDQVVRAARRVAGVK